jgi:hypothetical protein
MCQLFDKSPNTSLAHGCLLCYVISPKWRQILYYLKFSETWEKHGPLFIFIRFLFWPCNKRNKSLFRVRENYQWTANFDWLHSAETSTGKGKTWKVSHMPFCKVLKNSMFATSVINQYVMTVRCEFVREVSMRISKLYGGCLHELVEKLLLVYVF